MLVPGVDLIGPLLRTQADRNQDAFFPPVKTAESLVPKSASNMLRPSTDGMCDAIKCFGKWGEHIF